MDLMHNRHKLEAERDQATEYRKKFYSGAAGGFQGAGGGSFSNAGDSHGYSVPSSYTPASSYNAPTSSAPPQRAGDGVSKVYSPYNPADDPVLKVPTRGAMKWGADGPSSMSSTGQSGSTYNITNNNNINYNYGSNITAISSEGGGSVPTFHDLDKAKREAAQKASGGPSYAASAMGYVGSSLGSMASGVSSAKANTSGGLSSVTKTIQSSKGIAQFSDTIKRNTGLDIHRALGGKTAVDLAEERLQKDAEQSRAGYGGGYSGYQGISIPLTPATNS